jgi:hypothetical protein
MRSMQLSYREEVVLVYHALGHPKWIIKVDRAFRLTGGDLTNGGFFTPSEDPLRGSHKPSRIVHYGRERS